MSFFRRKSSIKGEGKEGVEEQYAKLIETGSIFSGKVHKSVEIQSNYIAFKHFIDAAALAASHPSELGADKSKGAAMKAYGAAYKAGELAYDRGYSELALISFKDALNASKEFDLDKELTDKAVSAISKIQLRK
ncbi:MAG: hypothetical protein KGI06_03105 [Candidatus Micrarchaeota archaeon]|nr:hypothetical protein [Candidatus Micrarchaeota archaeon]